MMGWLALAGGILIGFALALLLAFASLWFTCWVVGFATWFWNRKRNAWTITTTIHDVDELLAFTPVRLATMLWLGIATFIVGYWHGALTIAWIPVSLLGMLITSATPAATRGLSDAGYSIITLIVAVIAACLGIVYGTNSPLIGMLITEGLVGAWVLIARIIMGIPDQAYLAMIKQISQGTIREIRHMKLPKPISVFGETLLEQIHGQKAAITKFVTVLSTRHRAFCSPYSSLPLVVIMAGPESCGRKRLAQLTAKVLQGEFVESNQAADIQGEQLYDELKKLRVHGAPSVIFIEGISSSPKASDFLARVILDGHPESDDWSKAMVVIPIDTTEELPEDEARLIDMLSATIDRKLLRSAIILPLKALDAQSLPRVAIQMATDLARAMVTQWGMSDKLGPLQYTENQEEVFLGHSVTRQQNVSEKTAELIDSEVKRLVVEGYEKARTLLTEHLDKLHLLANALLEYETLTGEEIRKVVNGEPVERLDPAKLRPAMAAGGAAGIPLAGKRPSGFGGPEPRPAT